MTNMGHYFVIVMAMWESIISKLRSVSRTEYSHFSHDRSCRYTRICPL